MKITRNGVCYNLSESPYNISIDYGANKVRFFFSSQLNLDKFNDRMASNRKQINESLSNRFKIAISYNILCDINLYMKIENRGFYLLADGKVIEWEEDLRLNGEIPTRNY